MSAEVQRELATLLGDNVDTLADALELLSQERMRASALEQELAAADEVRAKLREAEGWIASRQRERPRLDGYTYRVPCDRVGCALHGDRSNGQPVCWSCADSDGVPHPLYLAELPYVPLDGAK